MTDERPYTLDEELQHALVWARPRLTSDQTDALCRDARSDPSPTEFARQAHVVTEHQLADVDWSAVRAARLIVIIENDLALGTGCDHFSSGPAAATLTDAERWNLYLHLLWREAERENQDAGDIVCRAVLYATAGPAALREVLRRMDQHVGSWAGVWFLAARWRDHFVSGPDPTDEELRELTRALERPARLHVQPTSDVNTDTRMDVLAGAVAETLLGRHELRDRHPLAVMADALDGKLNIMPTAIGNNASRDGRPRSVGKDTPRAERRIDFVLRQRPRFTEVIEDEDRIQKARRADPATIDALIAADGKKADAAASLGISRPTLDARIKKLRSRLAPEQN